MSKVKDKLLDIVDAARPAVQAKVTELLDDVIFPFYEIHSPVGFTHKTLRTLIAERIATTFSKTLWFSREDEGHVERHPFIVLQAFPQNTSATGYDIMVTISQRSMPSNIVTMGLHEFMHSFYPIRDVDFAEYDS